MAQTGNIIVDTSVWIEYFKNNNDFVGFIEDNLSLDNIRITGLIISELLHGVKSSKEYLLLSEAIKAVPYIECDYQDWLKTGEILFNLKKKGKTVPLSDAIISAIALRIDASVLTLDYHFREIEDVRLIDLKI
jgi:predicted nucleic acid-binding protein